MKRFLAYFIAIALGSVTLALVNDGLSLMLIHSSCGNPTYKMERLWSDAFPDEVAILGSSRALHSFVTSTMPKSFNYGADGMILPEIIFLLKRLATRKTFVPVIVNFDPWDFSGFDNPYFVGDYRLAPQSGRAGFFDSLPGLRFHGALKELLSLHISEKRVVDNGGAVLLKTIRTQEEWKVIDSKLVPRGFKRSEKGEREFEAVLLSLKPRKVIVAVGPCSSRFMELYPNMNEFKKYLRHLDSIENVTVVSMFGDPGFTDADFVDPTHLNIYGARKFTDRFMQCVSMMCGGDRM